MSTRLVYPKFHAQTATGAALAGGKLYTYTPGTTTPKATYSDADMTTANTNPVILDANGDAVIFFNGYYDLVLQNSLGVEQWTLADVNGIDGTVTASTYNADPSAADQGATTNSRSIASLLASIGTSKSATIVLAHSGSGNTTTYAVGQNANWSAYTNVVFKIMPGAVLSIATTTSVTFGGPIDAGLYQIFSHDNTDGVLFASNTVNVKEVYPEWWGALPNNTAGSATVNTAAVQAALTTTKTVKFQEGTYYVNGTLSLAANNQEILGTGWNSKIYFNMGSSLPGIQIPGNNTNYQKIKNIQLYGYANTSYVVEVRNPLTEIEGCKIYNGTTGGVGIYLKDEAGGSNIYSFGTKIKNNIIEGTQAGGISNDATSIGIYVGDLAHQSIIRDNVIHYWGTHIDINKTIAGLEISANYFTNSYSTKRSISINSPSSADQKHNINIHDNYFEANQVVVYLGLAGTHGLSIKNNYAFRNTASAVASYFFHAVSAVGTTHTGMEIEYNVIKSYLTAFQLDNAYLPPHISTKGNYLLSTTNWAAGTYLDSAYRKIAISPYFNRVLVSGTVLTATIDQVTSKDANYRIPLTLPSGTYIEKFTFYFSPSGANTAVIELNNIISTGGSAIEAVIATVTASLDQTYTVTPTAGSETLLSGFLYFLEVTHDNGGTSSDIHAFNVYIRERK